MSDNLDHHHDVCHYGGDPTPPTPPEMPKPDYLHTDEYDYSIIHGYEYFHEDGGNPIERYAKQLQAENAALREDRDAYKAFFDWMKIHHPGCCKAYHLAALHSSPAAGGKDEDE